MKKILIIALSLLTLTFAANAQDKKNDKISEVKFDVANMHGDHCKQRIEKSIPFEKGVKDVEVNLKENTATVKFDNTKTDAEKIKAAFEKLGYPTTIKVAEAKGSCCKTPEKASCCATTTLAEKKSSSCCKDAK
ncbi:MAG: cation transporter [Prevotellaceae bacterium]|jgi:copper chaperone CopZ|nr:cation transporter [Prevotellaceae bacterium]